METTFSPEIIGIHFKKAQVDRLLIKICFYCTVVANLTRQKHNIPARCFRNGLVQTATKQWCTAILVRKEWMTHAQSMPFTSFERPAYLPYLFVTLDLNASSYFYRQICCNNTAKISFFYRCRLHGILCNSDRTRRNGLLIITHDIRYPVTNIFILSLFYRA